MIAVIFEVWPHAEGKQRYLHVAQSLAQRLERIDGFISVERFVSVGDEGKLLSLSMWRDEQAVAAWRNLEAHRAAQTLGRDELFRDYRLRIAHVVRDYGLRERDQAPEDSHRRHD